PLPPLPDDERMFMGNLRGVVYGDGTVFLYNFSNSFPSDSFTAAMLCPGSATWTVMTKRLKLLAQPYAMYHDSKVLVLDGDSLWCFMMTTNYEGNISDVNGDDLDSRWGLDGDLSYLHECSYILESHGELLLASVMVKRSLSGYGCSNPAPMLRVTLRTMRKEPSSGKMQWVEIDGRNLGDHALFLGSPASLAVKLDEGGGCAYFVFWGGVFRYSFVDGEAKAMKWLRPDCRPHEACVWLRPSLSFTPIKEIKERL
uniref:KIB1-4 beta-propeller domain-containing protein n=2 Tax=Aegilops tauschii TaxID=37682 RepID=A0A453TDQ8_AEGTS